MKCIFFTPAPSSRFCDFLKLERFGERLCHFSHTPVKRQSALKQRCMATLAHSSISILDMMRLIFIFSILSLAHPNVLRYRFTCFFPIFTYCTIFIGLLVMVLPTPVPRKTMFLWTPSRYLMVTVKIFMETNMKSSQQRNLAVNV